MVLVTPLIASLEQKATAKTEVNSGELYGTIIATSKPLIWMDYAAIMTLAGWAWVARIMANRFC